MDNYHECIYMKECNQVKRKLCITSFEHCLVYQTRRVLDKDKPKSGLERFIERYGEDWREIAFAHG